MRKEKKNSKILFFLVLTILAIIKQILAGELPLVALPIEKFDDGWMMKLGYNIANHNWLGQFDSLTLMKELVGPIYLALCSRLGLSFIGTSTLLYSIACIIFVYSIQELFKKRWLLMLVYVVLLFNPVSYASWTLQRVYRCGLTLTQVLILFGCFFALYVKRKNSTRSLILWSVGAGLSLAAIYHTREDRIWVLPFVIVVTIVLVVNTIINSKYKNKKLTIKDINYRRLVLVLLPIVILMIFRSGLSYLNYKHYGLYSTNMIDDSNFSRAVSCFYQIKTDDDEELPRISVPASKLEVLYEASPTLSKIKEKLNAQWYAWGQTRNGENENGMIIWPLISAVEECGYYETATKADNFYKNVADELEAAIKNNEVESRWTMPSPLMAPWRNEYLTELPKTMLNFTIQSIKFKNVYAQCIVGSPSLLYPSISSTINGNSQYIIRGAENIEEFRFVEALTNDLAIKEGDNYVMEKKQKIVHRINRITPIYNIIFPVLSVLGVLAYVLISFKNLFDWKRKVQNKLFFDIWLILSSIILSYIVLIGGVSYNQVSGVESGYYMYRSGGYPLLIAFVMISITFVVDKYLFENRNNKSNGR